MATRPYTDSIRERAEKDPALKEAVLTEAAECFLNGEVDAAKILLHDFVKATIGFEALAMQIDKTSSSIKRMLGPKGNPTAANLATVLATLKKQSGGTFHVEMMH